jgi:hypothetical protein
VIDRMSVKRLVQRHPRHPSARHRRQNAIFRTLTPTPSSLSVNHEQPLESALAEEFFMV